MFLQLNDTNAIKSDQYNYMLCTLAHRVNKDTGEKEEFWTPHKYYTSLHNALKRYPDTMLRESDAKGWGETLKCLEQARTDVSRALTTLGGE